MARHDKLTDGQWRALGTLLGERHPGTIEWLVSHLVDCARVGRVTVRNWQVLRDRAYPDWRDDDWETIDSKFEDDLRAAKHAYLEHLGQKNLFT